jgi:hypothetical protein
VGGFGNANANAGSVRGLIVRGGTDGENKNKALDADVIDGNVFAHAIE